MRSRRTLLAALLCCTLLAGCSGGSGAANTYYEVEAETVEGAPDGVTVLDANATRVREATSLREVVVESVESNGVATRSLPEKDRYDALRSDLTALPHRTTTDDFYDDDPVQVFVEYRGEVVRVQVASYSAE